MWIPSSHASTHSAIHVYSLSHPPCGSLRLNHSFEKFGFGATISAANVAWYQMSENGTDNVLPPAKSCPVIQID
ncbi:unnamed protein product, partial [Mesorhabditis belari]|uniref:Uncharacterized protein n=1 Tax=Mesorhabditis belari TaxID=2138241 RepID=A0AAF3FGA7_9BILA